MMGGPAETLFRERYGNGRNFMTPIAIEYGWATDEIAYELSKGDGLKRGTTIYGVTFLRRNRGEVESIHDLSGCHDSLTAARAAIGEVS